MGKVSYRQRITMSEKPAKDGKTKELKIKRDEKGRILPGSILNPEGMKPGTLHFKTLLMRAIKEIGGKTKDGRSVDIDEIIVKKLITMAGDGNLKAIEMVLDRVDGKPTQALQLSGAVGAAPSEETKKAVEHAVNSYLNGRKNS